MFIMGVREDHHILDISHITKLRLVSEPAHIIEMPDIAEIHDIVETSVIFKLPHNNVYDCFLLFILLLDVR